MMSTTSIAGHLVQEEHQGEHHLHGNTQVEAAKAAAEVIRGTYYYYYGMQNSFSLIVFRAASLDLLNNNVSQPKMSYEKEGHKISMYVHQRGRR